MEPDQNIFLKHLRRARIRNLVTAIVSIVVAVVLMLTTDQSEIGSFAFHSLIILLLANALVAQLEYSGVNRPISMLLNDLSNTARELQAGRTPRRKKKRSARHTPFTDLSEAISGIITKMSERLSQEENRARQFESNLNAVPFTMFSITDTGSVVTVIQDVYTIIPVLKVRAGQTPSPKIWGEKNFAAYHKAIKDAFSGKGFGWFDMDFPAKDGVPAHHLRASAARTGKSSALVCVGDLPAIDAAVANVMHTPSDFTYTHSQDEMRHFAATIAHDAKNIFSAISNIVDLNRNSTDPGVLDRIPIADDAIRRGTELMRELMNYSGETRYNFETVSGAQFYRDTIENATIKAIIPPHIELVNIAPTQELPAIDIDREQIWRISMNLVKNAVEAIGMTGGRLWYQAEPFEMTRSAATDFNHSKSLRLGPGILFTRTDDGPGIPPGLSDKLFTPYFSSKECGRGIGLATVLTIATAHGGAVRVRSVLGRGTAFQTWIPASRYTSKEIDLINEIAPNGEILLVDDDPAILRTTGMVLKSLKLAAHPASTADDAIMLLNAFNRRIKAVLIDAHLKGSTTVDIVRTIHARFPELPVVLTSGSPEETIRTMFGSVSFNGYIEKPYSIADLAKVLESVIPDVKLL